MAARGIPSSLRGALCFFVSVKMLLVFDDPADDPADDKKDSNDDEPVDENDHVEVKNDGGDI